MRVCVDCGRSEGEIRFERGRRVCHSCRWTRAVKRAAARGTSSVVDSVMAAMPPPPEVETTSTPSTPPPTSEPVPTQPQPPAVPPQPPQPPTIKEHVTISVLRENNRRLQAQLSEALAQIASSEHVKELIGSLGAPNVTNNPEWMVGAANPSSTRGTPVLFLSDLHHGEVVNSREIGGVNEFNSIISINSIKNTFRNAVKILKGHFALPHYDGIVIPLGGDMISGNIHEELAETNDGPVTVSMIQLEEALIEGLQSMVDQFGKVHVPCVTGNHGRIHKKPRYKHRAFHNYEWLIYQRLVAYFRNTPQITFDVPEGPDAFFSIYGVRFLLSHGDQFSGGNGIGGIMTPIMRGASRKQVKEQGIGEGFDIMMIGHFHQYIHTNTIVINGTLKGYDEFANANNFPFEIPQQALFVVHPDVGVTFRAPIFCRKEA